MSKESKENIIQCKLGKPTLAQMLLEVDKKLLADMREKGCTTCGKDVGVLHSANYYRCARPVELLGQGSLTDAGPQWAKRFSLCCAREGCRKRHTPASVRFLGRKVYAGIVVVLLTALSHGLSASRVELLREQLKIDVKTLKRWRQWWLREVVGSSFWKGFRRRFSTPICEKTLPLSLCERFGYYCCAEEEQTEQEARQQHQRLRALLKALSPLSLPGAKNHAM